MARQTTTIGTHESRPFAERRTSAKPRAGECAGPHGQPCRDKNMPGRRVNEECSEVAAEIGGPGARNRPRESEAAENAVKKADCGEQWWRRTVRAEDARAAAPLSDRARTRNRAPRRREPPATPGRVARKRQVYPFIGAVGPRKENLGARFSAKAARPSAKSGPSAADSVSAR